MLGIKFKNTLKSLRTWNWHDSNKAIKSPLKHEFLKSSINQSMPIKKFKTRICISVDYCHVSHPDPFTFNQSFCQNCRWLSLCWNLQTSNSTPCFSFFCSLQLFRRSKSLHLLQFWVLPSHQFKSDNQAKKVFGWLWSSIIHVCLWPKFDFVSQRVRFT